MVVLENVWLAHVEDKDLKIVDQNEVIMVININDNRERFNGSEEPVGDVVIELFILV